MVVRSNVIITALFGILLNQTIIADPNTVFLRAVLPDRPVYRNEAFPVDLQVHYPGFNGRHINLNELRNHPPRSQSSDIRFLQFRPDFSMNQISNGGRFYPVYRYQRIGVASRAGNLKLVFNTELILDYFSAGLAKERTYNLATPPQSLTVKPLPIESQPSRFSGAVGEFSIDLTIDKARVRVNNPVELTLVIRGKGALDHVKMPQPEKGWEGFRVDMLTPQTRPPMVDPSSRALHSAKVFRTRLLPRKPGSINIPQIQFSYFDPLGKKYVEVKTEPVPLDVYGDVETEKTQDIPLPQKNNDSERDERKLVQKKDPGLLAVQPPPLLQRPWFLTTQASVFAIWFGVFAWSRRREYYLARPRLVRRFRVEKRIRQSEHTLKQLSQRNSPHKFYSEASALLRERIGERFDIPSGGITEAVKTDSLDDQNAESLKKFLRTADSVRFGSIDAPPLPEAFAQYLQILLALDQVEAPIDEV